MLQKITRFLIICLIIYGIIIQVSAEDKFKSKGFDSNVYQLEYLSNTSDIFYQTKRSGKTILWKNGKEIGEYDDIIDFYSSNDGKSYALTVNNNGDSYIIKDGIEYKNSGYPQFSTIGNKLGYFTVENESLQYYVDGEKQSKVVIPEGYTPKEMIVSGDLTKYVNKIEKDGKMYVSNNGELSKGYDEIVGLSYVDNKISYIGINGINSELIYGEKIFNDYESYKYFFETGLKLRDESEKSIIVSELGNIIYFARESSKTFSVIDGIKGEYFDVISDIKHVNGKLFYVGLQGDDYNLVVDGKKVYTGQELFEYRVSESGNKYNIFETSLGKVRILDDTGNLLGTYDKYLHFSTSKDGENILILQNVDNSSVGYINNKKIDGYKSVKFIVFSDNDKEYSFIATGLDNKKYIVTKELRKDVIKTKKEMIIQLMSNKKEILKNKNGELYINKLNKIVDKYIDNEKLLLAIYKESSVKVIHENNKFRKNIYLYLEGYIGMKLLAMK